jgi:hypothetical protein
MMLSVVLAVLAVVAALTSGYLFGARQGRAARHALDEARGKLAARVTELEIHQELKTTLAPLLSRERVDRDLSSILVGKGGLGELPRLLDAIAEKGGFSSVVLSDESGLPLAASSTASNIDALSGTAAFFLTMAERAERAALPLPLSCVLLDTANRITLHRVFTVGGARYTLSGVARGSNVAPSALDPALSPLERVLGRPELV